MNIEQKYAKEDIAFFFEMNEKFENASNRDLTENELYLSILYLIDIYESNNINVGRSSSKRNIKNIKKYFYENKNGTIYGLLKKVRDNLNLDLQIKSTDSPRERFEKLKLLKQICVSEKLGTYPTGELYKDSPKFLKPIHLIEMIKTPKLHNIYNDYHTDSHGADEFETVYNNLKLQLPNAKEIENEIYRIHNQWKNILNISKIDVALSSFNPKFKLESIKKQNELIKRIPLKLSDEQLHFQKPIPPKCSVIESFFIMMVTAKIRAEINDYSKINFKTELTSEPNSHDYLISLFELNTILNNDFLLGYSNNIFFDTKLTSSEFVELLEHSKPETQNSIWTYILHKSISDNYYLSIRKSSAYKYASNTKRLKNVASICVAHVKHSVDLKIPLHMWCIIFRELILIKLQNEDFTSYNIKGYTTKKSLSSIVSSLNTERRLQQSSPNSNNSNNTSYSRTRKERTDRKEAHSIMTLKEHIYDRFLMMYSSPEIISTRRTFVNHILSIEHMVLSYHTIREIKAAHTIMKLPVAIFSVSNEAMCTYITHLKTMMWTKVSAIEGNYAQILLEKSKKDKNGILSSEIASAIDHQLRKGIYWEYNISFTNENTKFIFASILYLIWSEEMLKTESKTLPKTESAIIELFYSCMNNPECMSRTKSFDIKLNIDSTYTSNAVFHFKFTMNHYRKMIIINNCHIETNFPNIINYDF